VSPLARPFFRFAAGLLRGVAVAAALLAAVYAQPAAPLVTLPAGWRLAPEYMAGFPAEGLQLFVYESPAGATPAVRSFCLAWDPGSPAVTLRPVLAASARTPTQFAAQEPGAFAAINAGYFGGNQSFSLVQRDGVVLSPNIKALTRTLAGAATTYYPTRAAFGLSPAGRPASDWIYHVGSGNALIYAYPEPSPNRLNGAPQPVPTATFPAGGTPWVMELGVGGSPMLVKDGVVRMTDAEELIDVNNTSRRARSGIGHTAAGLVLLVVVEGDNPAGSPGMTLAEFAAWMRGLGCMGAMNLDGGGSTSLVAGGRPTVRPGDGAERPVIAALVLADPLASAASASPVVVHRPWDLRVSAGGTAVFQVVASGGALAYQWTHDGVPLPGATRPALRLPVVAAAQEGRYAVTVSNALGRVTSSPATLQVLAAPPGELVNLSVRAGAGSGEDTLIAGFALRGATETVLARGIGPGLGVFGVTGFLEDPRIDLLRETGAVLAGNDDWEGAGLAATAAQVGAFPLVRGSPDAALVQTLPAGAFMVAATPARGNGRGNLLIEVYDTTAGGGVLANLSARARVAAGREELTAGFVVRGESAMNVLIRGIGPTLGGFGVGDAVRGPRLTLVRDGETWLANARWALAPNAADIRVAARGSGAFALSAVATDAAMLVTLPPGAYTATVAAPEGTEGVALVEIYEVR
jgi:hypothetical protein